MAVQQEMEKEMKLFEFFFFFFFNRKQIKDSKLEDALKVKSWKKKNGITKLDINNTTFISSFLIYSAPAETKKKKVNSYFLFEKKNILLTKKITNQQTLFFIQ